MLGGKVVRKDNSIDFLRTMKTTKDYLLIYLSFLLLTHLSQDKDVANSWREWGCRTGGDEEHWPSVGEEEEDADQAKRKKRQAEDILLTFQESVGKSQSSEVEVFGYARDKVECQSIARLQMLESATLA